MTEYIQRKAALKSLEYTPIGEAGAENIISLTLCAAREKVEKLPVLQGKDPFPAWRDPEKDPPEVETEVLVLYRRNDYLGITTAHYENGNVFSEDSKWNWEDLPDWETYDAPDYLRRATHKEKLIPHPVRPRRTPLRGPQQGLRGL